MVEQEKTIDGIQLSHVYIQYKNYIFIIYLYFLEN
jgi:hypothetical protein